MGPNFLDEVLAGFSKLKEEFEHLERQTPDEHVSEYEDSEGTKVREIGPIVYGYSITIGPEGKPVIREFGNVKRVICMGSMPMSSLLDQKLGEKVNP